MKNLFVIQGIVVYQKYISPHKGYCCAYKYYTNKDSCSEFAKKSFMKYEFFKAFILFIKHLKKCKNIYLLNKNEQITTNHNLEKKKEKIDYCDSCAGCL